MDKIKKLTPRKKSRFEYFLEQIYKRFEPSMVYNDLEHIIYVNKSCSGEKSSLLHRVSHSRFYLVRQKVRKVFYCSINIVRHFFVAARYHIFVADDVDINVGLYNMSRLMLMYHSNSKNYENRKIDIEYKDK